MHETQPIQLFLDDSHESEGVAYRAEYFDVPYEVRYARGVFGDRPRAVRVVQGNTVTYIGSQALGVLFSELSQR